MKRREFLKLLATGAAVVSTPRALAIAVDETIESTKEVNWSQVDTPALWNTKTEGGYLASEEITQTLKDALVDSPITWSTDTDDKLSALEEMTRYSGYEIVEFPVQGSTHNDAIDRKLKKDAQKALNDAIQWRYEDRVAISNPDYVASIGEWWRTPVE